MRHHVMGAGEWTLLVVLSVLWGGSFFFVEVALDALTPLAIVLGRVGIAAVALLVLVYLQGERMPGAPAVWGAFFVMGALNNVVPFGLIVWGQQHIESGLASILNATTPLFTVVLAHFLAAGERMTANRLIGVLAGIGGVALLIGPEALRGLGLYGIGQVAVLGAALAYACAGIYGRRLKHLPTTVAAAGMLTASTVMALPLALALEGPPQLPASATVWGAMLGLALLSTALAYLIYFRLLAAAGPTNLLLVTFLIPVSALALGVAVLGEAVSWNAVAGMALIFLGLAAVDGRAVTVLTRRFRAAV